MGMVSLRRLIRNNTAKSAVMLGQRLPLAAYVATAVLLLFSLSLVLATPDASPKTHNHLRKVCKFCEGRPLLGVRSFFILVSTMSAILLTLKHHIIPRIIVPEQFEEGFDIGKYYGFAAQILYHCVLCTCFAATVWMTSLDDTLYHLATLAEPAYCTIDVLLLLFTGTSFTHWQLKPLLVHHTISCACCHALMYGIPGSIYGKLLQLVFHFSSAICLGIANALQTPSLKLSVLQRLWMQVLSMMFWAITRVGLVFILGICVLIDAKRIHPPAYRQVVLELNAASIGSFAFVIIKTPIITRALQEAIQEYQGRSPTDLEVGRLR